MPFCISHIPITVLCFIISAKSERESMEILLMLLGVCLEASMEQVGAEKNGT